MLSVADLAVHCANLSHHVDVHADLRAQVSCHVYIAAAYIMKTVTNESSLAQIFAKPDRFHSASRIATERSAAADLLTFPRKNRLAPESTEAAGRFSRTNLVL